MTDAYAVALGKIEAVLSFIDYTDTQKVKRIEEIIAGINLVDPVTGIIADQTWITYESHKRLMDSSK